MYLSKLNLNDHNRTVLRDLGNAHSLHQRIMQGFPDENRDSSRSDWNILYRHEANSTVILVQSEIEPHWHSLPTNYLRQTAATKSFSLEEANLITGRKFRFRLKANPSKRDNETRKIIGLFRLDDQIPWLENRAKRCGFSLAGVNVMPTPDVFGIKAKKTKPIKILTVLYQGMLQINDPQLLKNSLRQGIGRGRSYGCGLLSLSKL